MRFSRASSAWRSSSLPFSVFPPLAKLSPYKASNSLNCRFPRWIRLANGQIEAYAPFHCIISFELSSRSPSPNNFRGSVCLSRAAVWFGSGLLLAALFRHFPRKITSRRIQERASPSSVNASPVTGKPNGFSSIKCIFAVAYSRQCQCRPVET